MKRAVTAHRRGPVAHTLVSVDLGIVVRPRRVAARASRQPATVAGSEPDFLAQFLAPDPAVRSFRVLTDAEVLGTEGA